MMTQPTARTTRLYCREPIPLPSSARECPVQTNVVHQGISTVWLPRWNMPRLYDILYLTIVPTKQLCRQFFIWQERSTNSSSVKECQKNPSNGATALLSAFQPFLTGKLFHHNSITVMDVISGEREIYITMKTRHCKSIIANYSIMHEPVRWCAKKKEENNNIINYLLTISTCCQRSYK